MTPRCSPRPRTPAWLPSLLLASTSALGASGCAPGLAAEDDSGVAIAAISSTPSGVACIRVRVRSADGALVRDARADARAGSPTEVLLEGLPTGDALVRGDAYREACTDPLDAAVPTWSSTDAPLRIARGRATTFDLELRPNHPTDVAVDFHAWPVFVGVGSNSVGVVFEDGTVRAFGRPEYAGVANDLTGVAELAFATNSAYVLRADGTVAAWGWNSSGALGTGAAAGWYPTPQAVSVPPARHLYASGEHACVITRAAELWCWGRDNNGEIGGGAAGAVYTTPRRMTATSVAELALGMFDHSCLRTTTGDGVMCSGRNAYGQLGTGTTSPSTTFASASDLRGATSVAVSGGASFARLVDASAQAWGALVTHYYPYAPGALDLGGAVQQLVATEDGTVCALRTGGAVACIGSNARGALGNPGTLAPTYAPVTALFPDHVTQLFAGTSTVCAISDDGEVYCTGANQSGSIGVATQEDQFTPVRLPL